MTLPKRKWLNHETPLDVKNPEFFITLNCLPRGINHLCKPQVAGVILEAVSLRHENYTWYVWSLVLMPDHLHAVVNPSARTGLKNSVADFKRWVAGKTGVKWQKGFFDHRIRSFSYLNAYCEYLAQNPVRAGLVKQVNEWPYYFEGSVRTGRRPVPTKACATQL